MQPERIAARVWPERELDIEPLGGGVTNRNFTASVGGGAYVLRVGGKDTELLGIDRSPEHGASLELDFDLVADASEHFERLRRTEAEPEFREALG